MCTTNPAAGRGVTTSLLQARQLISLLAEHGRDLTACSLAFDHWCAGHIKPWFDDHVYWDADLIRRWSGQDVDLTRPLPPDLIMAAAQADPEIAKVAGPYQAMLAPPSSLDAVQARARDIYATGWRPPTPPGPTRDELASLVTAAVRAYPAEDAALSAGPPASPPPTPATAPHGSPAHHAMLSRNRRVTLPRPYGAHFADERPSDFADVRALHLCTSMHSPACRQWRQQYAYLFAKLFWAGIEAHHPAISSLKHRPAG